MKILNIDIRPWIVVLIFVSVVIYGTYEDSIKNNKLNQSRLLTQGNITGFGYSRRSSNMGGSFEFEVNGRTYQGSFKHSYICHRLSYSDEDTLKKVRFPVLYHPVDPNVNVILLKKAQYERYNVPYPDDIWGVLDEYFGCTQLERYFTY
jgi:hypothetical protein